MYPTEMTREQRLFLVNLNKRLSETEKKLKKEALEIIDTLNKRANDDADWIHDFDLECTLEFYMREDDPDYSREKDHILAKFTIGICLMINSDRYLPGTPPRPCDNRLPHMPPDRYPGAGYVHRLPASGSGCNW